MHVILLTIFAISPETLIGQRSGVAWLLHPIKYGNPIPELAMPLPWWGIAWLDLPPTVLLLAMYIVTFAVIPRLALCLVQCNWRRPVKVVGCIVLAGTCTVGVWLALIVRGGLPLYEMKIIHAAIVSGMLTIGLWSYVRRLQSSRSSSYSSE